MNIEQTKIDLLAMKNGDDLYFNMHQDGGAMAIKVNYEWLVLFEIPLYGGKGQLDRIYHVGEVDTLIEKALSWT